MAAAGMIDWPYGDGIMVVPLAGTTPRLFGDQSRSAIRAAASSTALLTPPSLPEHRAVQSRSRESYLPRRQMKNEAVQSFGQSNLA